MLSVFFAFPVCGLGGCFYSILRVPHWWTVLTQQPHATWLTFLGHNLRLASQEEEQTLTEDMEEL